MLMVNRRSDPRLSVLTGRCESCQRWGCALVHVTDPDDGATFEVCEPCAP